MNRPKTKKSLKSTGLAFAVFTFLPLDQPPFPSKPSRKSKGRSKTKKPRA